jgi:MraZ protein
MSATETRAPIIYNSFYRHGVDGKRRLQVPAKWKPEEGSQYTLILWPSGGTREACLMGLPPAEMADLMQRLKAKAFGDPRTDALRRLIGENSDQVTVDKAGRICLPEGMMKQVGIEKEAVLVGLLDRFQIWNPDRYVATKSADRESALDAFAQI